MSRLTVAPEALRIGGVTVLPGETKRTEIHIADLPTQGSMALPVVVIHGEHPGPRIWISAAIHGDEVNGVEIVRKVIRVVDAKHLHGALLAVPIVNVFGFINESRYLPDRRDLNRCFPGTRRGSMASRLARIFMDEVVGNCELGIDLHTACIRNENLPQIRADLGDPGTRRLAKAFGAPVYLHSRVRDGSLREAAVKRGIKVLLYEAGEPLKFDEHCINIGYRGVLRVMAALDMIHGRGISSAELKSQELRQSRWVRAPSSGILRLSVETGDFVAKGEIIGAISDAFGEDNHVLKAPSDGIVIGLSTNPLVSQGGALVHLGLVRHKELVH